MTDNWNDLSSDEISVKLIEQLSSMMPGGAEALSSAIEAYSEQSADCCSSEPGADASDCRPQASAFESEPADAGLDGCASDQPSHMAILEAILFSAAVPVEAKELSRICGWPLETVQRDLDELAYALEPRGIRLQRIAGACRLVTAASCAGWVERYLDVNNRIRLNRPQLEALAIVAYNQPVTRAVIDTYRGVRSERVLGQLEDLRLIREVARADVPGRPILYGTTEEFLRYFALNSLDELPQLFPPPKPDEAAQRVPADPAPEASGREADNSGCGSEGASGAAGMSGSALDVPSERLQKLISKLRKKQ